MTYNLTFMNETTGFQDIVTAVNDNSGGLFISLFLLVIYLVILYVWRHNDFKAVNLAASFLVTILAALTWAAGWIRFGILVYPFLILLASVIYFLFARD